MAEKRFAGIDGMTESAEIAADYEAAEKFGKIRVGKLGAYFRDGFHMRYIPFEYVDRAFIRIHEVNGKLCCGSTVFQYFRLVFVHDGKEFADVINEDEPMMDRVLAAIARNSPHTLIGVEKND